MGFFSNLRQSWGKSSRLQELQKIIAPPNQSVNELASDLLRSFESGNNEKERALEDFLDLCESDAGVKKVMEIEHLSRSDLEELYHTLLKVGLGQWVKGHCTTTAPNVSASAASIARKRSKPTASERSTRPQHCLRADLQ
jgi:hypothetical protein